MPKTALATTFNEAQDSPGLLLWQLSNKWQAQQRAALKPFDITHVQFVLLATLTFAHGQRTFTQKQLASYAQIDVMMTSQVLRKLEQKALIIREPSATDKRAIVINPTPAGVELANRAVAEVEAVDQAFFGVLGASMPDFVSAMQKLVL